MCGFVGIINKNNTRVELDLLRSMALTLDHRGPDDEGHFIDNHIGFYHKRLSIIDLTSGRQPMRSGNNTIVFNGEIYNYIELQENLKKQGYSFNTHSDTEVILKMYEAYGLDSIHLLNGMFAFLIYDKRQNKLIVARDHFGIKPLYYFMDEKHILFASEIKALVQHPEVKAAVNLDSLQEYITFQFLLDEATLFKGIHKVVPAHYMVVDLHTMKSKNIRYWSPNFHIDTHHTESFFTDTLRDLLEDTIKIQMRSDVPLGAYLSGGMDSSIVTLLASKNTPKKFKTFTGAFREGPEFDETPYSREVVSASNAEAYEIYPTVHEFIDTLPKLIYHLDEPVAGPGLFPQYMVSKLASQQVKVILGGQGGDEIFGGYTRYVIAYLEQALKGSILETNEEGEHIVSLNTILPNLPCLKQYLPMMRDFFIREPFEPMDRRYFNLIDRNGGFLDYYSEDFRQKYNKESVFNRFEKLFNDPKTRSYYNKMTHFDMFGSLPALLQVEDRVSMAVSMESRVPLLDRRIVDLITSMPPALKFKGAEMKYIFKKAVSDLLPSKILNRKDKMGFPVPLHIWAKEGARDFIHDILFSQKSRTRGIFNSEKIKELTCSERPFGRQLWGVLCLELWFRQFIDMD
jgi:asparagine synthase (glutamine-hydrolysing)